MTAQRIASLISSATEIVYALGLGDRLVAVSHECDYPAEVSTKPRVTAANVPVGAASREIDEAVRRTTSEGRPLYTIDVDALAALAPDLIITQAQCDVCAVRYRDVVEAVGDRPELRGAKIVALNPQSLADMLQDIDRIGRAAGVVARSNRVVNELESRLQALRERAAALAPGQRPRVACIEWIDPPMLAGNWVPELIELAGGQSSIPSDGRHSGYARWEEIAAYDPQVVVIAPCGFDLDRTVAEAQALAGIAVWRELTAVREGRVFAVDGSAYFNRSGPRLVDTVELLAHLFRPDRFGPPPSVVARRAWRRLETRDDRLVPAAAT